MSGEKTLIVGGGIAGIATAYFLARRREQESKQESGHEIVLLEKEPLLGVHSTGRNAGILRTWTGDDPTRQLAEESAAFLREPPPGFSEVPLIDPVGLILVTDPLRSFSPESFARLKSTRTDLVRLSRDELLRRAPHFQTDAEEAWLLRDEGRLDTAAIVDGFERGARGLGVKLRFGAHVRELRTDAAGAVCGVRLATGEELGAERVIVAAGGWAQRLAREVGSRVDLRPTRRHLLVTEVDAAVDPRWPVVWTDGDPFYARPESGGLLLSACDQVDVDPDQLREEPEVRELVAEKTAKYLPDFADAGVAHFWAGVRTLTDDGRFVLGPDADIAGLHWAAGLGGHGMTCSAALGRLAAELVVDPYFAHPAAAATSPGRFVTAG